MSYRDCKPIPPPIPVDKSIVWEKIWWEITWVAWIMLCLSTAIYLGLMICVAGKL